MALPTSRLCETFDPFVRLKWGREVGLTGLSSAMVACIAYDLFIYNELVSRYLSVSNLEAMVLVSKVEKSHSFGAKRKKV